MANLVFYIITTEVEKDFWIDRDIVTNFYTPFEDLNIALNKWIEHVKNEADISISETAKKRREPIFIDTKNGAQQIGFIFKGSTEIDFEGRGWKKRHVNLWVEIYKTERCTDF